MDGRDAFLTLARDKHYEFSSLRRAQFSTLCMLYELHNQGQDKFVYTCNNCKNHVETRYHCTICDVRFSSNILEVIHFLIIIVLFAGFWFVSSLQRESGSYAQDGETGLRSRWRFIADWRSPTIKPPRSSEAVNTAVHSIVGSRLSMPRCKLSSSFLSEDEACRDAHEELQEKNSRRLSYLQAAYRSLLLSCKALQRKQMSRTLLSKH